MARNNQKREQLWQELLKNEERTPTHQVTDISGYYEPVVDFDDLEQSGLSLEDSIRGNADRLLFVDSLGSNPGNVFLSGGFAPINY